MSSAAQYQPHYTVADYERWEGDWELWNGIPVAMTPSPNKLHQRVVRALIRSICDELDRAGCDDCELFHEIDWRVSDDTVVRPDIAVTCDPRPSEFLDVPPRLIIEALSPSTAVKDRTAKKQLYEQQEVPFYLIVDPADLHLKAWRLTDEGYVAMDVVNGTRFELSPACKISVDLRSI